MAHPNVCRTCDVIEADTRHFLVMEYVDGEDLASLLRRIGRLPQDKGLEIAPVESSARTGRSIRAAGLPHRPTRANCFS